MKYFMEKGDFLVEADSAGAELTNVKIAGKEMLWQNDNGSWSGHAPILFPVCGNCSVTVDGKNYGMPPHGFAKRREFTLADRGEDFLRFESSSDEQTKKHYPFDFVLSVEYRFSAGDACAYGLKITAEVRNIGEKALYFGYGGHESFALDKDVDRYKLIFETDENLTHLYHDENGRLTGEKEIFGTVREFVLPERFLSDGKTLIFSGIKSSSVILSTVDGKPIAKTVIGKLDNLLLWHSDGSRMICIEPWSNLPDRFSDSDIEFSDKRGVYGVEPRSSAVIERAIEYYKR